MSEPIENEYFNWLCAKVMYLENPTPSLTYYNLLKQMHEKEFVYILSGDDNRAEDGVDLRLEFIRSKTQDTNQAWMNYPCSFFEFLIAFARRAEYGSLLDNQESDWFWIFVDNLGLTSFNDANYDEEFETIDDILDRVIWRNYEPDGQGGMFPLSNPHEDQRTTEIWYQFAEYLQEIDPI